MKYIKIDLDDKEYDVLDKVRDGLTWKDFFMLLAIKEVVELVKKLKK